MAISRQKRKIERKTESLQSTLTTVGGLIPMQWGLGEDTFNLVVRNSDAETYTTALIYSNITLAKTDTLDSGAAKIGVPAMVTVSAATDLWTFLQNFKNYVDSLAGPGALSGTGTINTVAKWSAVTSLSDSSITDDGTKVTIGTTFPTYPSAFYGRLNVVADLTNAYGIISSTVEGNPNFVGLAIMNTVDAVAADLSHTTQLQMGFRSVLDPEGNQPIGLHLIIEKAADFTAPAAARTNISFLNAGGGGKMKLMHDGRFTLNNVHTVLPANPDVNSVQAYLFDDGTYRQVNFAYDDGVTIRTGSVPLFESGADVDNFGTFTITLKEDSGIVMGSGTARWERIRNIIFLHIPPIVANLTNLCNFLYLETLPPEIIPSSSAGAFAQIIRGLDNGVAKPVTIEWQTLLGEFNKFRIENIDQGTFAPATAPTFLYYTGFGSVMSSVGVPQGGFTITYLIDV